MKGYITMKILTLVLCFSLAFLITLISTPFVKKLAQKIGAIDVPKDSRRMHKKPIPRLGGLAIFYGFLISILCFYPIDRQFVGIIIGTLIIVGVGIVDDVKQLPARVKLLAQLIAAVVVVMHNIRIVAISVPSFMVEGGILPLGILSIPVTIIWIIAVTNAVNLIDGLDGLAVGVSSIATFSLFFIAILAGEPKVALLTAAVAGACIGFMPYNFNPAKIFMGDTGALFLGFILSVVCIQGLFKGYVITSFVVPFLILGLPIFDTLFAILRRVKNKKPIMSPDRGHLHHKLVDMGFSQKQAVAILYVISSLLGITGVVVVEEGAAQAIVFVIAILLFITLSAIFSHERHKPLAIKEVKSENEHIEMKIDTIEIVDESEEK